MTAVSLYMILGFRNTVIQKVKITLPQKKKKKDYASNKISVSYSVHSFTAGEVLEVIFYFSLGTRSKICFL